ncbi:hypothetical protein [Hamadaea tsunoensis]|uniref:hypothetical protein n=1 Tax=Hamadaea tsunoensis TaxID=53368 RepID=UPI0004245CA2|nr:hypothetical protein [Hamadaea tsunoensis]
MDFFGYFALAWTLVYLGVRYAGARRPGPAPNLAAAAPGPASVSMPVSMSLSVEGRSPASVVTTQSPTRADRRRRPLWPAIALGAVGAVAATAWILRRRSTG